MGSGTRFSWTVGAAAASLALAACGTSHDGAAGSSGSQQSAISSGKGQEEPERTRNEELGVSYVVPKGFHEVPKGTILGVPSATFRLGDSKPDRAASQFSLIRLRGADDYPQGTSPSSENVALVDAFLKDVKSDSEEEVEGKAERAEWRDGVSPGASALVKAKVSRVGEIGKYIAFAGKDGSRWTIAGSFGDLPEGESFESLKQRLDAFAKSLRPL